MKTGVSWSLRSKILLPFAFVMIVVGALSALQFGRRLDAALLEEFASKGKALAKSLASNAQDTLLTRDVSTIQGFIDEYKEIHGVGYVYVLDGKGSVLAHTFSPAFPSEFLARGKSPADSSKMTQAELTWRGRNFLDIQAPILAGTLGYAHVGMDLDLARSAGGEAVRGVLVTVLLLGIVSFGLIFYLLNHSIRQIIYLSSLSRQISVGDLELDESQWNRRNFAADEIGVLAANFYKMISDLKFQRENLEQAVTERTKELRDSQKLIVEQQQSLMASSKMSALGEMAGGIAHEINNPLAAIKSLSGQLQEVVEDDPIDRSLVKDMATKIENTTNRIARIISGLRSFSRDGGQDEFQPVNIHHLVEETLSFCNERFKTHGVAVVVEDFSKELYLEGRSSQLSQVLLNLLNNAHDAIEGLQKKWIRLSVLDLKDSIEIQVTDCGNGVPIAVREKIFQPFFTTKDIGKGTGMGLSISVGIVQSHHGKLKLDTSCANTRFVVCLPKKQTLATAA